MYHFGYVKLREAPVWFGADPGGEGTFGVAVLERDGSSRSACVSSADEALDWLRSQAELGCPLGIDAPLWWSSARGGGRKADRWLRDRYAIPSGTVQSANSLRGAALVQGMMLAYRYRLPAPAAYITEAHPKALLKAMNLSAVDWQSICHRLDLRGPPPAGENERDAVLAAVAAREGSAGQWTHNLAADRDASELDPAHYWLAPVNYAWFE